MKIKENLWYYVAKCAVSLSLLVFLPSCIGTGYQPPVPEHLQDHG